MKQIKIVLTKVDERDKFLGFDVGDLLTVYAESGDSRAYYIIETPIGKHLFTIDQARIYEERK